MVFAGLNGLWLAYVAQSGYTPRAQVFEGLHLAAGAKAAVADYHRTHGRFPATNADAHIDDSIQGRFVTDVKVMSGGIIHVTFGGAETDDAIAGRVLTLRAIVDEDSGDFSWSCSAEEIAEKHRPPDCR